MTATTSQNAASTMQPLLWPELPKAVVPKRHAQNPLFFENLVTMSAGHIERIGSLRRRLESARTFDRRRRDLRVHYRYEAKEFCALLHIESRPSCDEGLTA